MGSKVVRAVFWQRTDLPPCSNMHGLKSGSCRFWQRTDLPRAQTCCASPTLTPARLANSPGFKSFRSPRWRIKFSLERFFDQSRICLRAQPLESSLGRVPQAADASCNKIFASWIVSVAEDCLSPERTFHGCSHMHFRGCIRCCFRGAKLLL